jgi:hypothetical protein
VHNPKGAGDYDSDYCESSKLFSIWFGRWRNILVASTIADLVHRTKGFCPLAEFQLAKPGAIATLRFFLAKIKAGRIATGGGVLTPAGSLNQDCRKRIVLEGTLAW